jgi:hypothetical protein
MDTVSNHLGARLGLAAAGAFLVVALAASPAQAVSWKPLGAAVTGKSVNTKLEYGPQGISCESEFKGTTAMAPSATIIVSSWTFKNCINVDFFSSASVSSGGTSLSLTATKDTGGGDGEAQFEFPKGRTLDFFLTGFFFNVCVYTLAGPQSLSGATFVNKTDQLKFTNTTSATWKLTGGSGDEETCGPAEEKAKFSGTWTVTPGNLEIEK